jgi:LysR family glycine cleavage system transcriptional activator
MPERFVVVCSPALAAKPGLAAVQDVPKYVLLQHTTLPNAWQDWLAAGGMRGAIEVRGPWFERFSLVLAAAIAGKGVALLPRFMVDAAVAAGQLVIPFDISLPEGYAYYLTYPEEKQDMPALSAFRDWLQRATAPGSS